MMIWKRKRRLGCVSPPERGGPARRWLAGAAVPAFFSLLLLAVVAPGETDSTTPPVISGGGVQWTWRPLDDPAPDAPVEEAAEAIKAEQVAPTITNAPAAVDVAKPAELPVPETAETVSTNSSLSHAVTTTATATNKTLVATDADKTEALPSDPTRSGQAMPEAVPALVVEPDTAVDVANLSAMTAPEPTLPDVPQAQPSLPSPVAAQPMHNPLANGRVTVAAGLTALEALESVFDQTDHIPVMTLVPTNVLVRLETEACLFTTEKPYDWKKAVWEILDPYELDFLEEERIVRFGSPHDVDVLHSEYYQKKLERNHTRINVNFSGGIPLHTAVCFIEEAAKISVNFDYVQDDQDKKNLGTYQQEEHELALPEGEAPPPPPKPKKTSYDTKGQSLEWRYVLRNVLKPHDFDFVEVEGTVRILTEKDVALYQQQLIDAKPLVTRVVRVYHADPEKIVELLKKVGGVAGEATTFRGRDKDIAAEYRLLKHTQAELEVAQPWEEDSKRYAGSSGGETLRSGRSSGGGGSGGASSTGGSGSGSGSSDEIGGAPTLTINYNSLNRPTTPPAIIIRDVEDNLDLVEQRIRELDKPGRQVLIEARFLDLGQSADRELGLQINKFQGTIGPVKIGANHTRNESDYNYDRYEYGSRRSLEDNETRTVNVPGSQDGYDATDLWRSSGILTNNLVSTFLNSSSFDRSAVLTPIEVEAAWNALQKSGDAKIVSQPMLVVGDHSEAVIRVATMIPILNKRVGYLPENQNTFEIYDWQTLSVGITLWVLPEICADAKSIRLGVHPQVTEKVGESVSGPDGSQYPVLEARELDTRVIVPDGNTLLMGGLLKSEGTYEEHKVPILGDIPVLSFLFRWRKKVDDRRNLVMMITPTILGEELPGTGYEEPSMTVSEPAFSTLGRNVKYDPDKTLKTALDLIPPQQDEEPAAAEDEEEESPGHTESSGEAVSSGE
jgi:type II secretory pathway component GspD/PulD (secretin)